MDGGKRFLAVLFIIQLTQGLSEGAYEVQVTPKYVVVNPGEDVSFMCRLNDNRQLATCLFKVAGIGYNLRSPDREKDGIRYMGAGLEQGECGASIRRIQEKHNGNVTCQIFDTDDPTEHVGYMHLIVAIPPSKPVLEVNVGAAGQHKNVYLERDLMTATCTVPGGRPAANLSWFLGEELITDGLRMPVEICEPRTDKCTITQNLTRALQASDDKKTLMCVASHHSLKSDLVAKYTINVYYPPKPSYQPFEHFGLVEGALGRVPIVIEANPQPVIQWTIGGDTINERSTNGRYTVEPTVMKGPGQFESVLLIDVLTKEDTDKEYKVVAHNTYGEQKYSVSISTSPEPKVLEMGAGVIIIIVVVIVLVLLVLGGVLYARAKGKLCFAGRESPRIAGESSDTESAEHTTSHKPKLSFVSVFKKKSDKVAADKEVLKSESSDQQPLEPKSTEAGENVVYAELDLAGAHVPGPAVVVRGDDDKTEYAEIIHTQPPAK